MTVDSPQEAAPPAGGVARWAPALAALFVVGVCYASALRGGFVFDDVMLIVEDQATHSLASASQFFRQGFLSRQDQAGQSYYFRPLTQLTYAVDWTAGGGNPFFFHLTNLLAHLGVTALLIAVARRLGAAPMAAALAALLFGLVPRLTESVAWVSGRTDVLASLFGLGALLVELGENRRGLRRLAVAALLLAGLLSKEVGVAWVAVLAVRPALALLFGKQPPRRALADLAAPLVALGAWATLRASVVTVLPPHPAPATQLLAALGTTAQMALVPWLPNLQVGLPDERPAWAIALGVATLGLGVALLVRCARRGAVEDVALVVGAGVSLLLALGFTVSPVLTADRLLYVPLAMAAVGLAPRLPERGNALALALGLLVLSFMPVTVSRALLWADELRLWEESVMDASPRNAGVRVGLFNVYLDRSRLDDAARVIDEAVALEPGNPLFAMNRAAVWSQLGRDAEAIASIDLLARQNPGLAALQRNAVLFRLRAGRLDEASALPGAEGQHARAFSLARVAFAPLTEGGPTAQARAQALGDLGATARAREAHRALGFGPGEAAQRQPSLAWLLRRAERDEAVRAAEALAALGAPVKQLTGELTWRFGADITGSE